MASATVACSESDLPALFDPPSLEVVDPEAWVQVTDPALDPLAGHRPANADGAEDVFCNGSEYGVETVGFEVSMTVGCNYFAGEAPALVDLVGGVPMRIKLTHFDLITDTPGAEAHVALLAEGTLLWETHIPLPSDAGVIDADLEVPADFDAGSTIQLHVHNHGYNSYKLLEFMVSEPVARVF